MTLPQLSIRRPVLATVINLVVLLVGLICYERLSVRLVPKVDAPIVTVNTNYPGANAQVIESQITTPIEETLAGIEGIDYIQSISRAESSQITVRFRLDREPEAAAADVRDRVAQARGFLPQEVREPVVQKQEADAQPIMYLAFSSDRHSQMEVADFADRLVKDRIQTISGVASANVFAGRPAMRIWLDAARLAAYALTPGDVEGALRRQNIEVPAGRVESTQREFTVLSETDLRTPEAFRNVVLAERNGYLVRLGDVARVEVGPSSDRFLARFKGETAVPLGVVKTATANPLDVARGVRELLPRITETLPPGMQVRVAFDSTIFIDASIQEVYWTLAEATALVVLVIFVFLRSLRATLVPLVTIPVSLIGAFAVMFALGFSINTLTLLAMVLAIGLVVDDAIVMLENIHRHIEMGKTPLQAALDGSREIAFAVVAMTITLAAVYVPISFSTGQTGKLFVEFALTLAGAVLVSGLVALTASPMMCSRLLKANTHESRFHEIGERALNRLTDGYSQALRWSLGRKPLVLVAALASGLATAWLFVSLPSELAPQEDQGTIIGFASGPEGATVDFMSRYARQMETALAGVPEVERYFVIIGFGSVNSAIAFAGMKPWDERGRDTKEIQGQLFGQFMQIPGVRAFPTLPPPLGNRGFGQPLQFVVQTTGSWADLQRTVDALLAKMRENPGLTNPDTDLKLNKPELKLDVNRAKLAATGVDTATLGATLETLLGSRQVTRYREGSEQYDVIVQIEKDQRQRPSDLGQVHVRAPDGQMVPLSNLVTVTETVAARELNHFGKLRAATVSAGLADGYSLGEAITDMEQLLAEVGDSDTLYDLSGQSREFRESTTSVAFLFVLALAFIYLVLAAQFESFVDPLVILLSVPLAIGGALTALWLAGASLNIYSQIGLITLIGLISKHGILLVEFANQLRDAGKDKLQATIESATLRLRPILMTTGAMVLGAVPLAIAAGAGAEGRQSIGWVVVGGMTIGTAFTLFLVPAVYLLLSGQRHTAAD
ncbi:MAG: efflux RND transporter permease subunit [Lysobacterales bacterium]